MKESKLFQLLSVLDLTEWNESKHFIKNRKSVSPQIKSLFDFLYQRRRNLNSSAFDIDYIRTKHFDDMSRKNVQNLMSKLCKLIEKCLVVNDVLSDDTEYNFRQFKVYNDRGLFKLANKKADALIQKWENNSNVNRIYFEYIVTAP